MDNSQLSLFPLQRALEWALFKECQDYVWRADQIDLSKETSSISDMFVTEKTMICTLIAAAAKDNVLFKCISFDLLKDFEEVEILSFIGCQIMADQNHYEIYSRLLEKYDMGDNDLRFYYVETCDSFSLKKKWLSKNIKTPLERVVSYACLKGIIGCVRILVALCFQRDEKLEGLSRVNYLIRRDLELHLEFAGCMCRSLKESFDEARVKELVENAVDIETKFAREAVIDIIRLESSLVDLLSIESFIRNCANNVLATLGCKFRYIVEYPEALTLWIKNHIAITRDRRDPTCQDVPLIDDDDTEVTNLTDIPLEDDPNLFGL